MWHSFKAQSWWSDKKRLDRFSQIRSLSWVWYTDADPGNWGVTQCFTAFMYFHSFYWRGISGILVESWKESQSKLGANFLIWIKPWIQKCWIVASAVGSNWVLWSYIPCWTHTHVMKFVNMFVALCYIYVLAVRFKVIFINI